ncbi:hypothetical protein IAI25_11190, partial [Streptococcus pseudopneumoniae]|uniref:hypothetical protein n=1 Tax=Streptococcus pseudopneumoniae TaxID=257758 RepID=UPI0018B0857C
YLQSSPYKPTQGKTQNNTQYHRLAPDYVNWKDLEEYAESMPVGGTRVEMFHTNQDNPGLEITDPIQHATVSHGKDEKGDYVSYYDKYDLASNP